MGVSERTVQIERDGWILVAALSPELVPEWVQVKRAALDDPEFRRIYVLGDQAFDWDPADPRLGGTGRRDGGVGRHSRAETAPVEENPASRPRWP